MHYSGVPGGILSSAAELILEREFPFDALKLFVHLPYMGASHSQKQRPCMARDSLSDSLPVSALLCRWHTECLCCSRDAPLEPLGESVHGRQRSAEGLLPPV